MNFESFMVYWARAFRKGSRGEKALESNTGFRNLLLDNPATTDQCLYKRQKLWLEIREKATFKQCLAGSACFFVCRSQTVVGDSTQFSPSRHGDCGPGKMLMQL